MNKDALKTELASFARIAAALEQDGALQDTLLEIIGVCADSLRNGGCVFFCGNGGSAADAQHFAAELTGRFGYDRPPLRSEALHTDTSYLTAVANDYGYDEVFARLLRAKAKAGDVLFGLSTSGSSANVCRAFEAAATMGVRTVAMIGDRPGKMRQQADYVLAVDSDSTARIQEVHTLLGHLLCKGVEEAMFPVKDVSL